MFLFSSRSSVDFLLLPRWTRSYASEINTRDKEGSAIQSIVKYTVHSLL